MRTSIGGTVAAVCIATIVACGRVADVDPASGDAATADVPASPDLIARDDAGRRQALPSNGENERGCRSRPAARVMRGRAPNTGAVLELSGERAGSFHNRYDVGPFGGTTPGVDVAACDARGVYFADQGCGKIALSACDGADIKRSRCIYIDTHLNFTASERRDAVGGHYVDDDLRCWSLIDVSVTLDVPSPAAHRVGGAQHGRFQATGLSAGEELILRGEFVACRAVTYEGTCR